jgi:hypothetical protein
MILRREKRNTWREAYPSVTLFITNFTQINLGSNPGLRCDRPTINSLSDGTDLRD